MSEATESPEVDEGWEADDDASGDDAEGADSESTEAKGEGAEAAGGGGRKRRKRRAKRDEEYYPEDDERALKALEFLQRVVSEMQMDCQVHLRRPKDEDSELEINLEITGPDSGRIIGKKGQVLGALQFLTNRVVNRPGLEKRHILVDAEGYRSRRDDSLATMARRLGKQAVTDGKIITFEPMNPRDRRVVHLALAKFDGVVTKSDGEGDDRRVQIIPVRR
ncbi:MAG: KH domain-containing protein [Polyangiaceae bacterium]|nr:KH domain-containing protein [Polyangiaceae bacterium]MCW5789155.1 KH domain-containing protein [Polyangiaceae bacterium]